MISRFSIIGSCAALVGAMVFAIGPVRAGQKTQTHVAWGYNAIPNKNYDCVTTCFANVGEIEIYHLSAGTYEMQMYRLYAADPSDLQVSSAQNSTLAYCTIAGWGADGRKTVDAFVNCYDVNGNPSDTYFTFLYQSRSEPLGSAAKGIAYLWADQPTEASYTPNLGYQYNSSGATNTMARNATGSYTATIPGLTKKGGNVEVTAYGSGPARCKTSGWSSDQSGTRVNILCFDATGVAADQMFTLAYTIGVPLGSYPQKLGGDIGAYVLANKSGDTSIYTPTRTYNYNGFKTGSLTAQKNSTGVYTLNIPGETVLGGNSSVLVTAYGTTNSYCTAGDGLEEWDPFQIFCYDQNGNPADSKFTALLQTSAKQ